MSARRDTHTRPMEAPVLRIFALVVLILLTAVTATHAQIFLDLDGRFQGPIGGDATFPGEEGTIEITSFQWGTGRAIEPDGGPAGPISSADLFLSKAWDSSSIKLLRAQSNAEEFSRFVVHVYEPLPKLTTGGSDALGRRMFPPGVYMAIELIGARLSSYNASSGEIGPAAESLGLAYDSMRIFYGPNADLYVDARRTPARMALPAADASPPRSRPAATSNGFDFVLPEGGAIGIDVHDANGRRVATVIGDDTDRADGVVRWDGTDDAGHRLPPGVYEARIRTADAEITRRMVIGD